MLLAGGVWSQEKFVLGLGSRKLNDALLMQLTDRAGPFPQPTQFQLSFNYDLGEKYWTFINFTTPFESTPTWNSSWKSPGDQHKIDIVFSFKEAIEFQLNAKIYGYQYSPGPVYP